MSTRARAQGLALRVLVSFLFALAWSAWTVGAWRKKRAADLIFGADLADALGPVLLAERIRVALHLPSLSDLKAPP